MYHYVKMDQQFMALTKLYGIYLTDGTPDGTFLNVLDLANGKRLERGGKFWKVTGQTNRICY